MFTSDEQRILSAVDHRPYPRPPSAWIMTQTWVDLLFAHWPVDSEQLRKLIPSSLDMDMFDEQAWVGVVPFGMVNVRPRFCPSLPWLSHFLELNVRTYVRYKGQPGVYFFSLDAANPVAVEAARSWYHLPYFNARMCKNQSDDGTIFYSSSRTDHRGEKCSFRATYKPTSAPRRSQQGTLEHWLTERYSLFTTKDDSSTIVIGEIHHEQWPLQDAIADITENSMMQAAGISQPGSSPVLHFAKELVTFQWLPHVAVR
jgi:uncharacterized protein YqjF (DUF2071 family)